MSPWWRMIQSSVSVCSRASENLDIRRKTNCHLAAPPPRSSFITVICEPRLQRQIVLMSCFRNDEFSQIADTFVNPTALLHAHEKALFVFPLWKWAKMSKWGVSDLVLQTKACMWQIKWYASIISWYHLWLVYFLKLVTQLVCFGFSFDICESRDVLCAVAELLCTVLVRCWNFKGLKGDLHEAASSCILTQWEYEPAQYTEKCAQLFSENEP